MKAENREIPQKLVAMLKFVLWIANACSNMFLVHCLKNQLKLFLKCIFLELLLVKSYFDWALISF